MGCTQATAARRISKEDIRDKYRLGRILGSGAFGQVRECVQRDTKEVFAVKIMERKGSKRGNWSNESMFRREVEVLRSLDHPHIIKFRESFEDRHFLYSVMEKCCGGELFEQVVRRRNFNEVDASQLCGQILSALEHLHSRNVIHRDVKAENFLFETRRKDSKIKLIDFGMSCFLMEGASLSEVCGSPHYLSPEIVFKCYDQKADIWAVGILLYLLVFGRYPFDGPDTQSIINEVSRKSVNFRSGGRYSAEGMSFLRNLLSRDPEQRPTAVAAMKHAWITREAPASTQPPVDIIQAVRLAHRKLTIDRTRVASSIEARRNRILRTLEKGWKNQDKTSGIRLSILNRRLNRQHIHRRDHNRACTIPSRGSGDLWLSHITEDQNSLTVDASGNDRCISVAGSVAKMPDTTSLPFGVGYSLPPPTLVHRGKRRANTIDCDPQWSRGESIDFCDKLNSSVGDSLLLEEPYTGRDGFAALTESPKEDELSV